MRRGWESRRRSWRLGPLHRRDPVVAHFLDPVHVGLDRGEEGAELRAAAKALHVAFHRVPFDAQDAAARLVQATGYLVADVLDDHARPRGGIGVALRFCIRHRADRYAPKSYLPRHELSHEPLFAQDLRLSRRRDAEPDPRQVEADDPVAAVDTSPALQRLPDRHAAGGAQGAQPAAAAT